ncbi:thioesterase family protein [Brevundimonas vitis]|uniref:Thioesterase family protein n=1 Tax=Brevundimonas vitisensis TaxID=2800818 RepID=A0ABX7BQ52_9CAUL|nr:thioesterase family protein [Brevundimonas vitisensis]QQQ18481.1 thioesterase family protein [Brevundimonas vitisensis]
MIQQTLEQALILTPVAEGVLSADLHGDFSNGPVSQPPEAGFPFGGLLAALSASAMRTGLDVRGPLRTLSVQYLAAARYGERLDFAPRLLRGGRSAAFAQVEASQGGRLTNHATATYGADVPGPALTPLTLPPPPLAGLDPKAQLGGPMMPRFAQHVEYRFDGGPHILSGRDGASAIERVWMRIGDGRALDEIALCYLLDALYPPVWTALTRPVAMSTVDLRYDFLTDASPETAPDGWAFFEFRMLDFGLGWTVDEATAWGVDGTPLAIARQRRKLAPQRSPAEG